MDPVAHEMLETIEIFRMQGNEKHDPKTGIKYRSLQFEEPVLGFFYEIRIPDPQFYQPPADFEKKYGMRGIAQNYQLPDGVAPTDLQTYCKLLNNRKDLTLEQTWEKMTGLWDDLTRRNPSLKKIRFNPQDMDMMNDMIMGVASAFNANDIQNYIIGIKTEPQAKKMEESPPYKELAGVFNKNAERQADIRPKLDIKWAASPETLQAIRAQFENRLHIPAKPASVSRPKLQSPRP